MYIEKINILICKIKYRRVVVILEKYVCSLPLEIKQCDFRKNDGTCLFEKQGCGFMEKDTKSSNNFSLAKKKKWYEQYSK